MVTNQTDGVDPGQSKAALLRRLLGESCDMAVASEQLPAVYVSTGTVLDKLFGGGLARGALTEFQGTADGAALDVALMAASYIIGAGGLVAVYAPLGLDLARTKLMGVDPDQLLVPRGTCAGYAEDAWSALIGTVLAAYEVGLSVDAVMVHVATQVTRGHIGRVHQRDTGQLAAFLTAALKSWQATVLQIPIEFRPALVFVNTTRSYGSGNAELTSGGVGGGARLEVAHAIASVGTARQKRIGEDPDAEPVRCVPIKIIGGRGQGDVLSVSFTLPVLPATMPQASLVTVTSRTEAEAAAAGAEGDDHDDAAEPDVPDDDSPGAIDDSPPGDKPGGAVQAA